MSNNTPSLKSIYVSIYIVAIILSMSLALGITTSIDARVERTLGPADAWAPPVMLSDLPGSTGGASVTGDSNGNVYVVWYANSEGKTQGIVDTVYFRHWDGSNWTPSVDILAVPADGASIFVDTLTIDAFGRLLLLWHRDRSLMLTVANPSEARGAQGWQTSSLLNDELIWESDIKAEANGTLHVLAAGQGQNVYYLRSENGGVSWTTTMVSLDGEEVRQVTNAALDVGDDGTLHATWTMNAPDDAGTWGLRGVLYARSTDLGSTWSEPVQIIDENGHGQSSVYARSDDSVLLFWNHSVGSVDGRYFAISTDAGQTWKPPAVAFDGISGISGRAYLFEDSQRDLQILTPGSAAPGIGPQGWYSRWREARWDEPQPVTVEGKLTGSEVLDARLVGGNRLLYVWTDFDTKKVWFTDQLLPVPAKPDVVLSLPAAAPSTPASVPTMVVTPAPTPTPMVFTGPGPQSDAPLTPLVVGVVPALLLVAVIIVVGLRRRGRA